MDDPNEMAAEIMALDLFPGRDWKSLTEGEQNECYLVLNELRRIMGESVETRPTPVDAPTYPPR